MTEVYFKKLKDLIHSGRLKVHIIIAPPRTNSSVVEHALGNSPDIDYECHEPFLGARHSDFDPDYGYQQIYNAIGGEEFEKTIQVTSVVIKEMSHWIGKGEEYKKLSSLATSPIVVLIRNPMLTVESRLRRVLSGIDMRYNLDLQRYLLDEVAEERGFQNWNSLIQSAFDGTYTESLDFLQIKGGKERLYDTAILTLQNHLLDLKSRGSGYSNWRDLLEKKLYQERDYKFFSGILSSNSRRLGFEMDEFSKLSEEVNYFKESSNFVVFDTTDIRAFPAEKMQEMCNLLGVSFDEEMIKWGEEPVDFKTEQSQEFEKLWYDTLFSSSRINPPNELPPSLSMFPDFMAEYLRSKNLPIYTELSKQKVTDENFRHSLNNKEFKIKVTAANVEQLVAQGLVEEGVQLGEQVMIKLKYIDPIYAVTNEPSLAEDGEFELYRQRYAEEIKIVANVLSESHEHLREVQSKSSEIKFI